MSALLCVGLSYKTAPVEIREQAALSQQQQNALLNLVSSGNVPGIDELVILSTCNRTEFYAVAAGSDDAPYFSLLELLRSSSNLSEREIQRVTYCLSGEDSIRHLLGVAASLDSQVIGEPQILGQITQAYRRASEAGAVGATLSSLMQRAIHAGKRVRHETDLGQGALSISAVATRHASRLAGSLDKINALIIGAGEMAQSTANSLRRRGVGKLVIASRTFEHAQSTARPIGATAIPYAEVSGALIEADIVITAANAPYTLLYVADIASGLAQRQGRPLLIFDIAMPRNVAPGVGTLPGIQLFNLDDLQAEAETNRAERERAVPQVETIIEETLQSFVKWQASREIVPVIRQLRANAERVRQAELANLSRHLPDLDKRDQHLLEAFSQRLINKLFHHPTVRLKARSSEGKSDLYGSVISDLFDLGATEP